jgi:hypothetical protein
VYSSNWLEAYNETLNMSLIISRYGTQVSLYPFHGRSLLSRTELPDIEMSDQERIEWACNWAEKDLL